MLRGAERLAGVVLVASLMLAAAPAVARDTAPRTVLRIDGERQGANAIFAEWSARQSGGCVHWVEDGFARFPDPLTVEPGERSARLVLRYRRKPKDVEVGAWRELDPDGFPAGDYAELPFTLDAKLDGDGEPKVWRVALALEPPPGYYIDLYARWKPHHTCGGSRQLYRTFAVETG